MSEKKDYTKYYWLFSFMLAALCMYILLAYLGLLSSGDFCLVNGDLKDNYIPAIRNLCRDIKNGESIYFTWNYGLGINTSLYNAYYSFSPFNILFFMFYNSDMTVVVVAYILIKIGLAAACFQLFVSKVYGSNGVESIVIAVFYAMCSYQVAFNIQNIIWLDGLIMLPVIFGMVHRLVNTGKWMWLTIAYAYIFISQFYVGYMIGIASCMYFGVCLWIYLPKDKKVIFNKCLIYFCAVVVAIGISAWVWLPTIMFMPESAAPGTGSFGSLSKNIIDIFNQVFWGEVSGADALFPYIYCGIPTAILAVAFFTDKRNAVKEKLAYGLMLFIMLLSCIVVPLYALWHGFDEPNSYAFRFSYIISFLMCILATLQAKHLENTGRKNIIAIVAGMLVIYAVEIYWQAIRIEEKFQSNNITNLLINAGFILLWIALGIVFVKYKKQAMSALAVVLIAVTMLETISNGVYTLRHGDKISTKMRREGYYTWDLCQKWALNKLEDDKSMYRVCYWQDLSPSSGINYGYNSTSYFGSADNRRLREVLGLMGLYQSPRVVWNFGITPATKMILGVKYDIYGEKPVELEDGNIGYTVGMDTCDYFAGMGYMVAGDESDYAELTTNAFENTNGLLSTMSGEDIQYFSPINPASVAISGNGLSLTNDGEKYKLQYVSEAVSEEEDVNLTFSVNSDIENCYGYIENAVSVYLNDSFYLEGGEENKYINYGRMSVSYIKEMEKEEDGYKLRIMSDGFKGEEAFDDVYFYTLHEEELEKAYNSISKETLNIEEYRDGYVKGNISVTGDNTLLFTSIPYEKGWKAYVNGKPQDITPVLYDAFIALKLPGTGQYDIELKFEAPGAKAGIVISAVSVLLLASIALAKRKLAD